MAKGYRPLRRDQGFLLPPNMREWLPADHLVWFLLDTIEVLDTGEFDRGRRGGVGAAGYDPRMLLGLLVYAYCRGVRSSRQIERLCVTDVAYRVLCAQDVPDHCTIARFRADCQDAFTSLFRQVLLIAAQAGLGKFGTVAIDGTKICANASIDANRGGDWLGDWLGEQVSAMVSEAEHADAAEADGRERVDGDRVPASLDERGGRAQRIRQAAAQVSAQMRREQQEQDEKTAAAKTRRDRSEAGQPVRGRIPAGPHRLAEAQAHLAREIAMHQAKLDRRAALIGAGKKPMGQPPVPMERSSRIIRTRLVVQAALEAEQASAAATPSKNTLPKTVANITDPESRLMPTRKGFLQGYNAQLAVTSDQLIVAVALGQSSNDIASLVPMMQASIEAADALHARTGSDEHVIGVVLADAGYCSEANLAAPGPDRLIALNKNRNQTRAARDEPRTGPPPTGATPRQAMDHRLRTVEGSALYKRRGATVEPGIGNLKKILDRFSRRGLDSARSELHLAASAFNLLKVHRAAAI